MQSLSRRDFLRMATVGLGGTALAACQPKVVEVTKIVEKVVEKPVEKVVTAVVKETVMVAGTPKVVEKVVEKVVTVQPAPREVTVTWATDHLAGVRGRMTEYIQKIWPDKYPSIKIKLEPIAADDYWTMMDIKMAAGTISDVVLFEGNLTSKYAQFGGFLTLNEFMAEDNFKLDDYYHIDSVIAYQGQYVGLPYQVTPFGWFYNKTLFQKEGQPLPTKDWTYDDFFKVAKAITKDTTGDGKIDQWGVGRVFGANPAYYYAMIANGGLPYDATFSKTLLNDPKWVEGLQWQIDMVYKHKVAPTGSERSALQSALGGAPFVMGKVGIEFANTGSIGNFIAQIADKFEWDLCPVPIWGPTKKKAGNWNDQPHVITRGAASRAREAWRFLSFLSGPEVSAQAAIERGWTPAHKATAQGPAYLKAPPPSMKLIFEDWLPNAFDCMFFDRWVEWFEVTQAEIDLAFLNERGVKESLDAATKKGDEVLAKGRFIGKEG
jgi:ABC-type glycerol-3-phosphate transport system substrate-binding protein